MAKITKGVTDTKVLQYMEIFLDAYTKSLADLQRLEDFQMMYDNVINNAAWPTVSKIPIPLLFTNVERALGPSLNYLFPDSKFISLTPMDGDVDIERTERAERALEYTVRSRVKLQHAALRTIKDCFKLSIGYGIIEPFVITPPKAFVKSVYKGEKLISSTRIMGNGNAVRTVRYRYISPGQIIVTQDGTDFNGPDRPSCSFFVDIYKEDEFRALYADQPTDGENKVLKGNPEEIIKEARDQKFDTRVPIVQIIGKFGGIDIANANRANPYIPVVVPVLKVYTQNSHIWIANGRTIIFEESDKYQTLRCPLLKASAWPDATRWYPMSSTEAGHKMALGVNIWVNAMFDLLTRAVKPSIVYDKTMTGNKPPEQGPNSDIGVTGDITKAVRYLESPQIPQGLFAIGDMLQNFYGSAIGQENFLQKPSPGLVRGGANAFESLLQTTTGREQLAGTILESGFIDPAINQILLYMQLAADETEDFIRLRKWNKQTGKEYVEEMRVTADDLVHAYDLSLNLRAKHKNSSIDATQRQAEFSMLKDDLYIDQYELRRRFVNDSEAFDRLILPREKVKEIEERNREAQQKAVESQVEQGQPPVTEEPIQTPEMQGLNPQPAPEGAPA